jgi:crotonobetainyl-CoA:carnitine CoA-transferase CaiB-like acyl-CoA transferase
MTASAPYAGLRVIELTDDAAGEMAGLQLAHMGADVVKVEPASGVTSRRAGPFAGDTVDPEQSLAYWYYNGNKRSVVLDVADPAGRRALGELIDDADVLVSSLHPRRLREIDLDLAEVAEEHPRLVVVSITPFGLTGPWADYLSSDLIGLATSGLLITSGYDDHSIPPIRPGGDQAFHTAASFAHIGLLLALIERQRSGRGDLVDVAMHDACSVTCELANPYWFYPRALVQRQTCRHAQPSPTQPALFECADGFVYFALILGDQKPWQVLVEWLASKDMAIDLDDPAYLDVAHRQANFGHIQDIIECFFLVQPAEDVYLEGQERGLPIGILNAPEELFRDDHLRARGFFVPVEHPGFGEVLHPGVPYRFSAWDAVEATAAPRLGEHNDEILGTRDLARGSSTVAERRGA